MESNDSPVLASPDNCCDCGCSCLIVNNSGRYERSVKRKYEEEEEEEEVDPFTIPGFIILQNARIGIDDECAALREKVSCQFQTIQDLAAELEEERNASSSATSEAMSMILRLQREKADIRMEATQFKRFAEEKMAHDQEEILELDDLLYKREEVIQSLISEVQVYKQRMISYGLDEHQADGNSENTSNVENLQGEFESPAFGIYPPLRCNLNESLAYDNEADGLEETIEPPDKLMDLEFRINELERNPGTIPILSDEEYIGTHNVLEKVIVDDESLEQSSGNRRKFSTESLTSIHTICEEEMGQDLCADSPKSNNSLKNTGFNESNLSEVDHGSEVNDRVYTIDSIHQVASLNDDCKDDYKIASGESQNTSNIRDLEIEKLHARLHALEVDRETMRQTIVTIGTEKAQLVLLKEIAQNFRKEMSPVERMPVRTPPVHSFSFLSMIKWIIAFVFLRRKACRSKYTFGLSPNNAGLLMLLDRSPRVGHWRSVSHT